MITAKTVNYLKESKLFNEMLNNQGEILVFDLRTKEDFDDHNLSLYSLNLPFDSFEYKFFSTFEPNSWEKMTKDSMLKSIIRRLRRFYIVIVVSNDPVSKANLVKLEDDDYMEKHLKEDSRLISDSAEVKGLLLYKSLVKNKIREIGYFVGDYCSFLSEFDSILYHKHESKVFSEPYPSSILDYRLYVGNEYHAKTYEVLFRLKITHVINVTCHAPNFFENNNIKYLQIKVEDNYDNEMSPHFQDSFNFIESALFEDHRPEENSEEMKQINEEMNALHERLLKIKNCSNIKNELIQLAFKKYFIGSDNTARVFIHCSLGVSRSSTIAIMYLMKKLKIGYEEAFDFLKFHRNKSSPIETFANELLKFEERDFQFE